MIPSEIRGHRVGGRTGRRSFIDIRTTGGTLARGLPRVLSINPVLTMFLGWVWLDEWPLTLSLVGGAIALVGVVLTNLRLGRWR
jgi:drug/metabolite transporter (DMT)-like permease